MAASSCINQVYTVKKVGNVAEVKGQSPYETVNKNYCLNGDGYSLVFEATVVCSYSWWFGGESGQNCMWKGSTSLKFNIKRNEKLSNQNPTKWYNFFSKSDFL